eukprot:gene45538-57162_t
MGSNSALPTIDVHVAYSLGVAMSGLCLYTLLLAMGASVVASIDSRAGRLPAKLDAARDSMAHMQLPVAYQEEVVRYYRNMWASCKGFSEEAQDAIVQDLPDTLATRMRLELNTQVIAKIPLFHRVAGNHAFVLEMVSALQLLVALPGPMLK